MSTENLTDAATGNACEDIANAQAKLRTAMAAMVAEQRWDNRRGRQHEALERMTGALAALDGVAATLADTGWYKP